MIGNTITQLWEAASRRKTLRRSPRSSQVDHSQRQLLAWVMVKSPRTERIAARRRGCHRSRGMLGTDDKTGEMGYRRLRRAWALLSLLFAHVSARTVSTSPGK